ncbi:hypothetical protein PCYB_144690 [Plasmodium cynomolgi strain B]|uniref:Uncharacterized protein n=1 Tax=Plasmodium cynomolgi (strain B) TaxID=1120755 RepID=K6UEW1_PLACD|nr:hypothetical protein PCYB_144690 [Plasmodium cynomolgi strain B]GAB69041.1 hypothetical protein PCYB_144690 [Plasmodium cynomolgi strain B]
MVTYLLTDALIKNFVLQKLKARIRMNVINEALEEISLGASTREDKNTKRLKDERTFLNQKRRVLNQKIKKLRLIN